MAEQNKVEQYSIGSGNLKVTAYSGDGHSSTITIRRDNALVAAGNNKISDADAGPKEPPGMLYVIANISRTASTTNVSFTVELSDDTNNREYKYFTVTQDNVVIYNINIELS